MTYHADPLHSLYDLTHKCCTFLQGCIRNFITKKCTFLIETSDSNSVSEFSEEEENRSIHMAHTEPIDISSSDSEVEIEPVPENGLSLTSTNSRKLPPWANNSSTKSNGYGGPSGIQKNPNNLADAKFQKHPTSTYTDVLPNHNKHRMNNQHSNKVKWDADRPMNGLHIRDLDSSASRRNSNMSTDDNEKNSSQQSLRSVPSFFHSSALTGKVQALMENRGKILISDTASKPYQSFGTNTMDHKIRLTGNIGRENNDDITIYEHGKRLLPASLGHMKHHPSSQSAGPSNFAYHTGVEEEPTENDERLVYQAALENLAQPKLEATLPDGLLAVPLLRHQKIALAWMYKKETTSLHCLGGILADDQGLGKTVSMIALILLQKHLSKPTTDDAQNIKGNKAEALNLDDDDDDVGISEVERVNKNEVSDEVETIPKAREAVPALHKGRPAAGTLVVCPASVLRQWARELEEKVVNSNDAKLDVLIYHGGTRTKDPVQLAKHDVVLTTYAIVANEVPKQPLVADDDEDQDDGEKYGLCSEFSNNKKRKSASNTNKKGKKGRKGMDSSIDCSSGTLAKVGWFRVILDEAQTIKNHRTQVARACCGLRAKRRWCLSGTPIQNTIDDLFSYFRFLKYDPYSVYRSFCSSIKYPISRDASHGYKKLQAVLKTIMLRRTKGMQIDGKPIINLPPKSICLKKVNFSVEERDFYSKLEADSRSQFKAYAAAGTVNQNYANILLMLLRLRQACDHPLLVKGHSSDFVGKASVEMARRLPKDFLINLVNLLEDPICCSCSDPPEQAVVTMCGHVFCYQCVSEHLTGEDNVCPAHECKEQVGPDVVFAKATLRNCISGDFHNHSSLFDGADRDLSLENMYTSSKIRAALEILEKHCKLKDVCNDRLAIEGCNGNSSSAETKYLEGSSSDACGASNSTQREGPTKAIVFSQWTGMLDLVETSLNHSCIQYRRFDGTMSLASRDRAVKDFNNDPEVTVMLMSLKAGNLGLNLVAACHVILLDLWWNPTTEDQAIDRAHRIGQTRPVTVSRLTVTDTVEDRILALQEEKRKMVASAFGEEHGGQVTRLTIDDLRYLFMV